MDILIGQSGRILGRESDGGNTDFSCSRGPAASRNAVPGAFVGSDVSGMPCGDPASQ